MTEKQKHWVRIPFEGTLEVEVDAEPGEIDSLDKAYELAEQQLRGAELHVEGAKLVSWDTTDRIAFEDYLEERSTDWEDSIDFGVAGQDWPRSWKHYETMCPDLGEEATSYVMNPTNMRDAALSFTSSPFTRDHFEGECHVVHVRRLINGEEARFLVGPIEIVQEELGKHIENRNLLRAELLRLIDEREHYELREIYDGVAAAQLEVAAPTANDR